MITGVRAIDAQNPDIKTLEEAASVIIKGGILICPTDTGYAFAVNALDIVAIKKLFVLKKRSFDKPIHMAVSGIDDAEKYAYIDAVAKVLAREFLPGALTLVLPRKDTVPSLLTGGRDTIGIRVPDNKVILTLTHIIDRPLTTTSANISGMAAAYNVQEIIEQLVDSISQIALTLDQGPLPPIGTSTILDLTVKPPQILRQGLISESEIFKILRSMNVFN